MWRFKTCREYTQTCISESHRPTQQLHTKDTMWQYKTKSEITFCWTLFRVPLGSLSHCLSFQPFLMLYRLLLVLLEPASSCLLLHLSAGGWGGGGTINYFILYMGKYIQPRIYLSAWGSGRTGRVCTWHSANMMSVRVRDGESGSQRLRWLSIQEEAQSYQSFQWHHDDVVVSKMKHSRVHSYKTKSGKEGLGTRLRCQNDVCGPGGLACDSVYLTTELLKGSWTFYRTILVPGHSVWSGNEVHANQSVLGNNIPMWNYPWEKLLIWRKMMAYLIYSRTGHQCMLFPVFEFGRVHSSRPFNNHCYNQRCFPHYTSTTNNFWLAIYGEDRCMHY